MAVEIKQTQPQARPRVEILSRRLTCKGIQYVLTDGTWDDVVTICGGYIGCTCGLNSTFMMCSHIEIASAQENVYLEEAQKRETMHALFDITNQEMMEAIYGQ